MLLQRRGEPGTAAFAEQLAAVLRTNRKRTTETEKTLAVAPVAWPNNRIFRQLPFFSVKQKAKLPHLNFWIKTPIFRQAKNTIHLL
jgi:hypothetical protein